MTVPLKRTTHATGDACVTDQLEVTSRSTRHQQPPKPGEGRRAGSCDSAMTAPLKWTTHATGDACNTDQLCARRGILALFDLFEAGGAGSVATIRGGDG